MNKCPYCGSDLRYDCPVEWRCGSVSDVYRSRDCLVLEIGQLKDRVKELEEARTKAAANSLANMLTHEEAMAKMAALIEAGDLLAEWHLAVVTTREKAERDVARWNEAKGEKP